MARQTQTKITNQEKTGERELAIPHSRSYGGGGGGYKLSAQRFLGSLGSTNVSYDWLLVFTATINQSQVMFAHPNNPRNRSTESLYPIP